MFKLIKYEFKGNSRTLSYLFAIGILLNLVLGVHPIGRGIAVAAWLVIGIVMLASIVKDYSEFLYDDSAMLTFSLPISSDKFIISKLIYAVIILMLFIFCFYESSILAIKGAIPYRELREFVVVILKNPSFLFPSILIMIFTIINFILSVFFSITLTKVSIKKRRLSSVVAFVIFVLFNSLCFYVKGVLFNLFPYDFVINLKGTEIFYNNSLGNFNMYFNSTLSIIDGRFHIAIVGSLFTIAVMIGLISSVSYLVQKKVDI